MKAMNFDAEGRFDTDKSGDCAELLYLDKMREERFDFVFVLRNVSGNGIDLIGLRLCLSPVLLRFVEVKYNKSRLNKYQKLGGNDFVRDRLTIALNTTLHASYSGKNDKSFLLAPTSGGGGEVCDITMADGAEMILPYLGKDSNYLTQEEVDGLIVVLRKNPQYKPVRKLPSDVLVEYKLVRVMREGKKSYSYRTQEWIGKPA